VWEAIAYVSSGITLVAFIAALIGWSIKSKSEEHERLIRTAKESDRGKLESHLCSARLTSPYLFRRVRLGAHALQIHFVLLAVREMTGARQVIHRG
jgi:hypothetical protein